ncbi:MAG TPA: glycosyltransferase family 4 protein [Polyangiaceae bacterium]|nr:glycosyltransferase family 4 protein [Polyangiaceae bacterium]
MIAEPGEGAPNETVLAWRELLENTGGDLSRLPRLRGTRWPRRAGVALPRLSSVYLDDALTARMVRRLERGETLFEALHHQLEDGLRCVRYAPLDVHEDCETRVGQVITSLQQGGAERVALDLTRELPRLGVRARTYSVYSPTRASFPAPSATVDLPSLLPAGANRAARVQRLAWELAGWGCDLVHAHLLDAEDLIGLSRYAFPTVVTVHNTRQGFPSGLAELPASAASLLVACARAVENEIQSLGLSIPTRTVWNGVASPPEPTRSSSEFRERHGIPAGALVLAALANPRPQKRLHLLPSIMVALDAHLEPTRPKPHLLMVGSSSGSSESARRAQMELEGEVARCALQDRVHYLGATSHVHEVLAGSDVLVSPSEHEGLSLAHLEALSQGIPVVATGSGGTAELAALCDGLTHLPLDFTPLEFAQAVLHVAQRPRAQSSQAVVARHFHASGMAAGYARLYARARAGAGTKRGDGVLLVTNNFSTGGAQSSARRLLCGMKAVGVRVRAAVIEEQLEFPTPGRRALLDAGIPVLAIPPPVELEPGRAVEELLRTIDRDPPAAVLLWNVIPEHKLLLVDGLWGVPVYDVSPGEMYFSSLERYFRKPRAGLPYLTARDYGSRLSGVIVKYHAESQRAREVLGTEVYVIPNGIQSRQTHSNVNTTTRRSEPTTAITSGACAWSTARPFTMVTATRLHPDKKLEDLLLALHLAAPRLPPHRLRIAGEVDGDCAGYAARLRELSIGLRVEWVGECREVAELLGDADLFVLIAEPAGCPNASLEAMAFGLPILATDVGGMREQVIDGVNGCLVTRGSPREFAAALIELASSAERLRDMGRAGLNHARQTFSLEKMVRAYAEVCLGRSACPDPADRGPAAPDPADPLPFDSSRDTRGADAAGS